MVQRLQRQRQPLRPVGRHLLADHQGRTWPRAGRPHHLAQQRQRTPRRRSYQVSDGVQPENLSGPVPAGLSSGQVAFRRRLNESRPSKGSRADVAAMTTVGRRSEPAVAARCPPESRRSAGTAAPGTAGRARPHRLDRQVLPQLEVARPRRPDHPELLELEFVHQIEQARQRRVRSAMSYEKRSRPA